MQKKILLMDDDSDVRKLLGRSLRAAGFIVDEAASIQEAFVSFQSSRPDVAVLDFRLTDGTALDLLPKLKQAEPGLPVIVMTGYGSMELGVTLIKGGAEQCLAKPIEPPALLMVINRVLENTRNQQKQLATKSSRTRHARNPFLGVSAVIERLSETAHRIADSHSPVLIQGETGTGKGVLAAWLHENGPRAEEAFVDLNCAGLSKEFLETELFGYEKGAYTGAVAAKMGLLEVAHHGTIFLDEIGDVDPNVQPKLLKAVEEKKFRRLGDVRDRSVNTRLIAATHQDLRRLMEEKQFRADLYFRISTVPVVLPSLRDRREDIPMLVTEMLQRISPDMAHAVPEVSTDAMQALCEYRWPGNIRELRNVLERAMLMAGEARVLEAKHFFFEPGNTSRSGYDSRLTLQELERLHIQTVLNEEDGNVDSAATRLGLSRSALYQRLRTLNIPAAKKARSSH